MSAPYLTLAGGVLASLATALGWSIWRTLRSLDDAVGGAWTPDPIEAEHAAMWRIIRACDVIDEALEISEIINSAQHPVYANDIHAARRIVGDLRDRTAGL